MSEQMDIRKVLGPRGTVKIDPEEHEAERASRLRNQDKDASVERFKNVVTFLFALAAIVVLIGLCGYYGLVDKEATAETRRWAQTGLSSLLTGIVTFIVGQKFGVHTRP